MVAEPHPTPALVQAFSEIAQHVYTSEDYEDTLRRITGAARSVHGCDSASLSLLERSGPRTHAATDDLAAKGDQVQYEENEGPCLDAAMDERWVYTPDLAHDQRWPRSARRLATELGVGSMVSCRLTLDAAPRRTLGGLNMYSTRPHGFTDDDHMLAVLLASLAAVVADASRQQANLRAAIESRQVIGEAIGILRAQDPTLTRDAAFRILSLASQRMNVRLTELARQIADRTLVAEEDVH